MSDDKEKEGRQKPACSKCKQLVKGHVGPTGVGCTNAAEAAPPGNVEKMDSILSELTTQMLQMNVNLATLITRQTALLSRFDGNAIVNGNVIRPDGTRPRDHVDGTRPRDGTRPHVLDQLTKVKVIVL